MNKEYKGIVYACIVYHKCVQRYMYLYCEHHTYTASKPQHSNVYRKHYDNDTWKQKALQGKRIQAAMNS